MSDIKLLHNPRCSKSREALSYLEENKINFEIIEYLKKPLSQIQIKELAKKLKLKPEEFIRKNETVYKENNLNTKAGDDLIKEMSMQPSLIERPILIIKDEATVGRPLENIIKLISKHI